MIGACGKPDTDYHLSPHFNRDQSICLLMFTLHLWRGWRSPLPAHLLFFFCKQTPTMPTWHFKNTPGAWTVLNSLNKMSVWGSRTLIVWLYTGVSPQLHLYTCDPSLIMSGCCKTEIRSHAPPMPSVNVTWHTDAHLTWRVDGRTVSCNSTQTMVDSYLAFIGT